MAIFDDDTLRARRTLSLPEDSGDNDDPETQSILERGASAFDDCEVELIFERAESVFDDDADFAVKILKQELVYDDRGRLCLLETDEDSGDFFFDPFIN